MNVGASFSMVIGDATSSDLFELGLEYFGIGNSVVGYPREISVDDAVGEFMIGERQNRFCASGNMHRDCIRECHAERRRSYCPTNHFYGPFRKQDFQTSALTYRVP